jgi:uncharacterized protein YoxC
MIVWTARIGLMLLQATQGAASTGATAGARAFRDTVVTIQVPVASGWFATISGILHALMTLAILVLTIALVPAAWNFRKSYKKVSHLLDRVYADVAPIVRHTHAIADNVDYLSTTVRSDVQRVHRTVTTANERLLAALDSAERRVRDFQALMDVAQREAEGAFVSTASTWRGVRRGASVLRDELEGEMDEDYDDEPRGSVQMGPAGAPHSEEPSDDDFDALGAVEDDERARPRIRPRAGYADGDGELE